MARAKRVIGSITFQPFPDDACSICYESMQEGQQSATHSLCGKSWHEDCFLAWIMRGDIGTCPNCRGKVCKKRDEKWYAMERRINNIFQLERGLWTHGTKDLGSNCRIRLLPQTCLRIVIWRCHLSDAFFRCLLEKNTGTSPEKWLMERVDIDTKNFLSQDFLSQNIQEDNTDIRW